MIGVHETVAAPEGQALPALVVLRAALHGEVPVPPLDPPFVASGRSFAG
ncbi:MAG: hypothetical protein U0531_16145 [Dehalococcoidia bacterium]